MCGRFTLRTPAAQIVAQFDLAQDAQRQLELFGPRYNIAPTQQVFAVRQCADSASELVELRWGLIPSWAKDPQKGPPLINARGETVSTKPSFRSAFRRRRCLVLADGFYEWQQTTSGTKKKQPYYISRVDGAPFAFAGLWEVYSGGKDSIGPRIESCTIITTAANRMMGELHERMPVVLAESDHNLWLDPTVQDRAAIEPLIAPCGDDELIARPVSTYVNKVQHDDPQCLEVQATLFE